MNTERDIKYCLSEGISREYLIINSKHEEILADISEVLRQYNKVTPRLTSEEAIKRIREIVNKEDPEK